MRELLNQRMKTGINPKLAALGFKISESIENGPFGSAYWVLSKGPLKVRTVWDARDEQVRFEVSEGKKDQYGDVFSEIQIEKIDLASKEEKLILQQLNEYEEQLWSFLRKKGYPA